VKTDPPPHIVEIIDDDSDIFHDHPANTSTFDSSGRRWIGPAAALALLAVIGYGVVTSASVTGPPKVAAPAGTAAIASTTLTRALAYVRPEFYVADLPAGYTMQSVESIAPDGVSAEIGVTGPAELWATEGAGGTNGTWFVVSDGTRHATGRNSNRDVVGEMEVVIEHDPESRQSRLTFTKDGHHLEITAFGWADRQLKRLAKSVSVDGNAITFADMFFTTDHRRVLTADPMQTLLGFAVARVTYVNVAADQHLTITVGALAAIDDTVPASFSLTDAQNFPAGSKPELVGRSLDDPSVTLVQWHENHRTITLTGNLSRADMIALLPSVHASPGSVPPLTSQLVVSGSVVTIGSGMLGDGYASTMAVDADISGGYVWMVGQPDTSLERQRSHAGPGPSIETLVERGRTYVFAKAPRSTATQHLRVFRNGQPTVETDLSDISPKFPDMFAAYVFLEPVPFNADIIDSDGHVLASWPTPTGS
jgi:hypothetical protein